MKKIKFMILKKMFEKLSAKEQLKVKYLIDDMLTTKQKEKKIEQINRELVYLRKKIKDCI